MRAALLAISLAIALPGCSDRVADAERELAIVKSSGGNKDELCAAKRKVAEAHEKARHHLKHQDAKAEADIACSAAKSKRGSD
jgi:hypothetical protein